MEQVENNILSKEEIITRSDKAIHELNDRTGKHEKLLKLLKSWQEEDESVESNQYSSVDH